MSERIAVIDEKVPKPIAPVPLQQPTGNPFLRGVRTVVVQRRIPYRVGIAFDKLARCIGIKTKIIRAADLKFVVRRLTCDVDFVRNITGGNEYTPIGFEIGEDDTVIDIGGNIGTFALLAAQRARNGRVFTIEPNAENFRLLRRNISINRAGNVTPICAAVANSRGRIALHCASEGGYHSILDDRRTQGSPDEWVEAIRLQDVFDTYAIERCDFLKLDCEGAEHEILLNLPGNYFRRIRRIAMEWHGAEERSQRLRQAQKLVECLVEHSFAIQAFTEFVGFRGGMLRAIQQNN